MISLSDVILILASPAPELVDEILSALACDVFWVSLKSKLPLPVLSRVWSIAPSKVMSASEK